jgi:hypothetical protein
VPESQALKLIGYQGKPKKRFKLTNEQARILAAMRQIDDALTIAGIKPSWMHTRSARLRRQTPLERIEAGAINEVLRILAREALLASVNDENSGSRQLSLAKALQNEAATSRAPPQPARRAFFCTPCVMGPADVGASERQDRRWIHSCRLAAFAKFAALGSHIGICFDIMCPDKRPSTLR